ncbi:MAG: L,D-transpeptidase [Pseudobacteriovorax sp.]|nr:L,D-transpeptidase [Pseudobacteriovorax sp.]
MLIRLGIPYLLLSSLLFASSCSNSNDSSDLSQRIGSETNQALVNQALSSTYAFRLNLTTNRASFYENGIVRDQWNIATGDITGDYHDSEKHFTPTGVFSVDRLTYCPVWRPSRVVDPATGEKTRDNAIRQQVFAANPEVYGACGSRNPLGHYMIAFQGPYYMHGNSNESVLKREPAERRRVSGGCVRSPNTIIKSYFHRVMASIPGVSQYRQDVKAMEQRPRLNRSPVTHPATSMDTKVVVGWFDTDPSIGDSVSGPVVNPEPVPEPTPEPTPDPIVLKEELQQVAYLKVFGVDPNLDNSRSVDLANPFIIADRAETLDRLRAVSAKVLLMHYDNDKYKPLIEEVLPLSVTASDEASFTIPEAAQDAISKLTSGSVYVRVEIIQTTYDGYTAREPLFITEGGRKLYAFYYNVNGRYIYSR